MEELKEFGLWKVKVDGTPFELEYFGTKEGCENWFKFNGETIISKRLIYSPNKA